MTRSPFAAVAALALAGALACPAAQASLITFDPIDEQGITLGAGDAISAMGFSLTQANDSPATLFAGDLVGAYASNGSNSLFAGNRADINLSRTGGGVFNLLSLALGGGNLGDPSSWASMLQLVGLTADNLTLVSNLLVDPVSTGLAQVDLNWVNLTQVSFRGANGDYSLDDLQLQAVPEPASWALVVLGLAALLAGSRRRTAAR